MGALCRKCPFSKEGKPASPVYGEGPPDPDGLVFAESPGQEEIAQHRLLVGATGQEFGNTLLSNGLQRARLFIINVVACQPVGPKSDASMKQATECCRPFVLSQIRKFGQTPNVLTLGGWAYYSLHGHKLSLDRGRGFLREWKLDDMIMANWDAINRMRTLQEKHERKKAAAQHSPGRSVASSQDGNPKVGE